MDFKCLFCLEQIRDNDLISPTSCDHFIHEWCIDAMKNVNEHQCKLCSKIIVVEAVFKECDLSRATTINILPVIVEKLEEIIKLLKSRENSLDEVTKNCSEIADKVEGLAIEHHALKFEKREMEKRLKRIEEDKDE